MSRRVIAVVAAASVFIHTIVGCCAHHSHADQTCHQHDGSRTDSVQAVAKTCHDHSTHHHGGQLDGDRCGSGSRSEPRAERGEGHGSPNCPGDGPSHCSEQQCSFWAPQSSCAMSAHESSDVIFGLVDLSMDLHSLCSSLKTNGPPHSNTPFSRETLRHHLALSVLLI